MPGFKRVKTGISYKKTKTQITAKEPKFGVNVQAPKNSRTQCTLAGECVTFVFDGEFLSGIEFSCEAVSGKPIKIESKGGTTKKIFNYSKERQKLKNEGSLPEGEYTFTPFIEGNIYKSSRHVIRNPGWGNYSWELKPKLGTITHGRGGFFIHGGWYWGSAGCIDIKEMDKAFNNHMERIIKENKSMCLITVSVCYLKEEIIKTEESSWFG